MSLQDASPGSYSKETGNRDDNDEDPNTRASEHTWAKGALVERAKPIIAKDLHSLSIPAAAKYSANRLRFLLVQELSLSHCQFLRNKLCNDDHKEAYYVKAFRGILYIKNSSASNKVRI